VDVSDRDATPGTAPEVRLRKTERRDIPWMVEMTCDEELVGSFNWPGERRDRAEVAADLEQRFAADRLAGRQTGRLVAELTDGTPIGDVSWRTDKWGPSERSRCYSIGIALLPPFRGRGYGVTAQRLLIDHLFERDPELNRVQADTAIDNYAEQKALARAGMTEEGVVRGAEFRAGAFHDHVLFGIVRAEWEAGRGRP
jgi:RimJ/RimL family protein N-acetyltransferase